MLKVNGIAKNLGLILFAFMAVVLWIVFFVKIPENYSFGGLNNSLNKLHQQTFQEKGKICLDKYSKYGYNEANSAIDNTFQARAEKCLKENKYN